MTRDELFAKLISLTGAEEKSVLESVNIHAFNQCFQFPVFRNFVSNANLVICDGFGVKIAARFLDNTRLIRLTPADWMPLFCQVCAEKNITMYFLGAAQGIAETAAKKLREKCPRLSIVGVRDGFFDKSKASPENLAVLEEIHKCKPDILVVGFGMPLQEKWIYENWDDLEFKVVMPVGALFDYLSGNVRRAPAWVTNHGLEWLGRMLIEPHRLWKRYVIGNPLFYYRVLKQKLGLLSFPE